jgi:hypothetical protein
MYVKKFSSLLAALSINLIILSAPSAYAEDTAIETAALRCSAISAIHSILTEPTPQFGELMTEFAGLFAQVHILHKGNRTKAKVTPNDVRVQRDEIIAEMSKGWPGVKNDRVREAAICNAWRINLFAKLPEKATEKDFQAALLNIGPPPANVSPKDLEQWATLTPQAFASRSQMKVAPKAKKQ